MQLIERIKQKLSKESKSILTMSKETGIPAYRIYKWMDGKGNPKSDDAGKLEKWLSNNIEKVPNPNNISDGKPTDYAYLATTLQEELLAEKEKRIQEIEARRRDAEALAAKMESHYNDMKEALERAQNTINDVLKPITEQITANSDQNRDQVLQMIQVLQDQTYIVSTQLEHQREALGLGFPGQKKPRPVPFVKTSKGSSVPRQEDANKGKGG